MVFSSVTFLYYFLPLVLISYYIVPKAFRNAILLLFSLLFYYFGEKNYIFLLLFSCLINYILGRLLKNKNKVFLLIGLLFNIGLLFYFKYTNFFIKSINDIFMTKIDMLNIILPLGISFFTFQNISYLIDVYKGEVKPEKNILIYTTYITLFPQLIAGPIVRYSDIKYELLNRKESIKLFSEGIREFIIGLGKKVLIADNIFYMYSAILKGNLSVISYILVAISFTLQIYYDFSGYSNMAIGLGKMFGFNFKQNFAFPLSATSITEFWRRWHISLSSFFRDYVYIPLGGNKKHQIRNILIVWLLTGFWHGADYNFILWGLYFFIILIIEKYFLKKYLTNNLLAHIYTFILIVISFIIFSISDLNELGNFFKGMFGINTEFLNKETISYLLNYGFLIIISLIGTQEAFKKIYMKGKINKVINVLEPLLLIVIMILATSSLLGRTFTPFIYFRF